MSRIYYKFKSRVEQHSIVFDGLGLSVHDAKREILVDRKLDGVNFDFELVDQATDQVYYQDSQMI